MRTPSDRSQLLRFLVIVASALGCVAEVAAGETPMLVLVQKTQGPQRDSILGQKYPAYEYAELTINNTSTASIELPYNMHISQYFTPVVRRESGEVISSGKNLGRILSVLTPGKVTIAPGASHNIDLRNALETVPDEKLKPGKYHFRVQFQYNGKVWESNEIDINYK